MLHIAAHALVPLAVAVALYRPVWRAAAFTLLATMAVDVDHLLANPVYDPARCSIGFHPLHSGLLLWVYLALTVGAGLWWWRRRESGGTVAWARTLHWVGLGLVLHMALDWGDCLI